MFVELRLKEYNGNMPEIKKICSQCKKEFLVIKQEQEFLEKMNLPLPNHCPTCRQLRRLRDRGERTLYKATCQNCNKSIIVTYDPKTEKRKILCKECYLDWFEKNPVLVNE